MRWNIARTIGERIAKQVRTSRNRPKPLLGVGVVRGNLVLSVLREHPCVETENIGEALSYAAWRAKEVEIALNNGDAATSTDVRPILSRHSNRDSR